jgi:REP element-mobilizing transposase RayT
MVRKLRIEYPGAVDYLINRWDQREPIFNDDRDRQRSLCSLSQASQKTEWQVQAYCLPSNHFHLVVEMPNPTCRCCL